MLTHINTPTFKAVLNFPILETYEDIRLVFPIYDDVLLTVAIRFIIADSINAKLSLH